MAETPLMRQYRDMKKQYTDAILFFRLGDFYEMFDEDAIEVSSLLNLTLTHKGDSPMCGIPYHAAKNYVKRLLDSGKKIAVCEQLSLSDSPKALAKREVVRIITPATVVEEDFLDDTSFSYILSVFQSNCAFCDISTGDFKLRHLDSKNRIQDIRTLIQQIDPKEIILCEDEYYLDDNLKEVADQSSAMLTKLAPWYFSLKTSYSLMCQTSGCESLKAFGIEATDKVICPAGALLKYVTETSKTSVSHLSNFVLDDESSYLSMDESSRRNLELFKNLSDGSTRYSLCDTINRCKTSSGTRLLKNWIAFPLRNIEEIQFRQNWIKYFFENRNELNRVGSFLSNSLDLNRLTTRVLMKKAVPHDLTAIKQSLLAFFSIVSQDPQAYVKLFEANLTDNSNLDNVSALMNEIDRAVNENCLGQFNAGEVILSGYDTVLDEKRQLQNNSDKVLKNYLEEEKQKSGLTILKLGYNKVFGYYLEIPNGQVSKAPDYFIRKQTLVNGERYTTESLINFEREILNASFECENRERYLYEQLLNSVLQLSPVLISIGHFLSTLDVFQGLATLAIDSNYVCPQITNDNEVEIINGRHPVVEKQLPAGRFVSNNLDSKFRFNLITGPNMAGKSTYLRQNALIILMAHTGSFVPADSAKIGLTDKIFCRVGAMDNLARGQSTFLVEMQEAAFILRNCTENSFVIIDEIGRGTSTQDGMSIAYAIMNELISKNCKTLFATHYHELTMLDVSNIRLLTLDVKEEGTNVTFLRKIKEGVANSSYGIHVAKLAGVPYSVIKTAKNFQNRHFADYTSQQTDLFSSNAEDIDFTETEKANPIVEEIKSIDTDNLSPMQALILLTKLKEKAVNQ